MKKSLNIFVIILTILFLTVTVYAATSPWTETDWSGGGFDSSSNVTTSTAGQVTLANTEELSNTGFESDLTSWSEVPSYTLNDQFTTDRAAGAVNGTSTEPTGGVRTVTDTNSKLSITGGQLSFATGGAGNGNPGIWYPSLTRVAGKAYILDVNVASGRAYFGFDTNTSLTPAENSFYFAETGTFYTNNSGTNVALGTFSFGISYKLAMVLRGTGAYFYIKGGTEYPNWTLVYINNTTNTTPLYPMIGDENAGTGVFTADNIRIPTSTWLPTPLSYDTFTRADGAIGSSETTGPDSQTTPSLTWTGGAISTNKNVITPTLGSELVVNGNMETSDPPSSWNSGGAGTILDGVADERTGGGGAQSLSITSGAADVGKASQQLTSSAGSWVLASAWARRVTTASPRLNILNSAGGTIYNGSGITSTNWSQIFASAYSSSSNVQIRLDNNSVTGEGRYDDVSVKPLTLSSLFSTVSTSDADVIADANVTLTTGTQAGLVLNLDSTSSPANFIIVYHDGTNLKVEEAVSGVYTTKQTTAVAIGAGALRVIRDGTKLRAYLNNALVGAELTMTANTNTKHGLFSTYSGNSFDNFTLWDRKGYTDAPFEELVSTRDTTTKYAGSGSVKLVTSGTDANYLQSKNVGDTNTYDFTAYAYEGAGQAVTTDDVNLYYDGAIISTTFTSVGSDWYKLSGTVTGVASAKDFGVRVKSGKTLYLDNFSLNSYASSGTLTSSIFDSGQGSNWGDLTYTATTPASTSVTVKARTSNDSGMSGATAFSSCTAITSDADISSNNCITDTHRYIQYQLTLANSLTTVTPTFSDISIAFTVSDANAPSIALTALSTDPNTDTTPTLSGTATEAIGTVGSVQYQMDSTSGTWTACTADDAIFDEATETFTCTSTALSDGSHTMYVRATDSNLNTTSNANASTDTFTIDATPPVSFDLDSPGDNSYTNNERPTFKWKATTDATSGLSKYVLEINNLFTIDNIPTSRTTDYETNKYIIHYEGGYISLYTKSHSDWGSSENDGKVKEGKVGWKVKAVDNAGNETSSSRTLYVDRTNPKIEVKQINDILFSSDSFSTNDRTPTIYGKITDPLVSEVASGPKQVEIKVEKKEGLFYKLITLYTINMGDAWRECDECSKYLPFEYTSNENLEQGKYRITLTGKDKADNASETNFTLNITTLTQITTPGGKGNNRGRN